MQSFVNLHAASSYRVARRAFSLVVEPEPHGITLKASIIAILLLVQPHVGAAARPVGGVAGNSALDYDDRFGHVLLHSRNRTESTSFLPNFYVSFVPAIYPPLCQAGPNLGHACNGSRLINVIHDLENLQVVGNALASTLGPHELERNCQDCQCIFLEQYPNVLTYGRATSA